MAKPSVERFALITIVRQLFIHYGWISSIHKAVPRKFDVYRPFLQNPNCHGYDVQPIIRPTMHSRSDAGNLPL